MTAAEFRRRLLLESIPSANPVRRIFRSSSVEKFSSQTPLTRGVGEVPIVPPLAAVQTAMNNALGVRFTKLPISPEAVLEELLKGSE
jgi:CO/xanthine dehydrogenase Mo-binding subunit